MICPKCKEELKRSKVRILSMNDVSPPTTNPFFDEEGIYHCHGVDNMRYKCLCDNNHSFTYIKSMPCFTARCGFVQESVEFT